MSIAFVVSKLEGGLNRPLPGVTSSRNSPGGIGLIDRSVMTNQLQQTKQQQLQLLGPSKSLARRELLEKTLTTYKRYKEIIQEKEQSKGRSISHDMKTNWATLSITRGESASSKNAFTIEDRALFSFLFSCIIYVLSNSLNFKAKWATIL